VAQRRRAVGLGRSRNLWGYAVATLGTVAMAGLLSAVPTLGGLPLQTLLMLTVVVGSALLGGLWPAVVAALLSGLTLNVLFIDPTGSVLIADPRAGLALAVFVVIGIAVALVVDRSARLAQQAIRARREADALAALARRLLHSGDDPADVLAEASQTLGMTGAAIWRNDPGSTVEVEASSGTPPAPGSAVAARATVESGVSLVLSGPALRPEDRMLLTAYAGHLRVLRERARAEARSRQATELAQGNRVRTALLAAVSHDLRTPLAAIKAAASSLRSTEVTWSADDQAELLATIEDGADRLELLVANLLDLSRLQTGAVLPLLAELDLRSLVDEAVVGLDGGDRLEIDLPTEGVSVRADPGLAERVIANVVDNALQHSAGSRVRISAAPGPESSGGRTVALRVIDHGPGVPAADRDRLFQPFQPLGDAPGAGGLGLGLAVALGLADAMGGRLEAEDSPGGGLTMVLTLPAGDGSGGAA
jgi:two-component system sensor histidine kinase KdpD